MCWAIQAKRWCILTTVGMFVFVTVGRYRYKRTKVMKRGWTIPKSFRCVALCPLPPSSPLMNAPPANWRVSRSQLTDHHDLQAPYN